MNSQALFLFLVLLIGLVISSFLGGSNCMREGYTNNYNNYKNNSNYSNNNSNYNSNSNYNNNNSNYNNNSSYNSDDDDTNYNHNYDNYNHYNKSSSQLGATTQLQNGTIFNGPNGDTAVYVVGASGISSIQLKQTSGSSVVIFNQTPQGPQASSSSTTTQTSGGAGTKNTFYGPGGMTATIVFSSKGNTIVFNTPGGRITFTQVSTSNSGNNTISQSAYYGSTGTIMPPSSSYTAYDNSTYGVNVQGPYGGSVGYAQGPYGNTVAGTSNNGYGNNYYSTMPPGIPASQIPPGQEDLYILKSEVVPPVCPACPAPIMQCPDKTDLTKCPPCPPCARCPEPAFDCKKVPNYGAFNQDFMPVPVMNDFSTFGM
jgi:hypothetical protein